MADVSFENRVVIVTGAGNGLGKAYALELGKRGAKVVVNDLGGAVDGSGSGNSPADDVVNEIIENGGEAVANYDSVATKDGGESIVQTAVDSFGTVDAVINNAGILRDKSFANMTEEEFSLIIEVHLKGTYFVTQPAFKIMKENNYGRIVNVASVAGKDGNANASAYSVGKAGAIGLTKSLGKELADKNIAVNAVTPAGAKTRILDQMNKEHVQRMLSKVPRGRFLEVEEFTSLVCWLSSEENTFSTAAVFDISGGRSTY